MEKIAILLLLSVAGAAPAAAAPPPLVSFCHPTCGYSLAFPNTWHVVAPGEYFDEPCSVTLQPVDIDTRIYENDVNIYTLYVFGNSGGVDEGAETSGFQLVGYNQELSDLTPSELEHVGERVIYGRQGIITLPEELVVGEYQGLFGYALTGCFHDGGGYAGLCEVPVAFLTNGQRWVAIHAEPGVEIFEEVLNSLCLEAPPN